MLIKGKYIFKLIVTLLFLISFAKNALAGPLSSSLGETEKDVAELSSKIGSAMFSYYQFKYHDQVVAITTLQYCGNDNMAQKVAASLPDLQSFYLEMNPRNLLDEIIYKEAMVNGYDLTDEKVFEQVSTQSMATGQSFYSGYLKGYQVAMKTFFDKEVTEPFCNAAAVEAEKYINVSRNFAAGKRP